MGASVGGRVRRWAAAVGLGRGATQRQELDPDRADLLVVARGFDEVQACSTALAESPQWREEEPAVLRHHLRVPAAAVAEAVSIAAQDGYAPAAEVTGEPDVLVLQRVQLLDALHCSQERSRMVGLAQRLGGDVLGWDALQAPAQPLGAVGR
ncbi:hypothetical protein [Rhodococcus sp. X156]|uniref:hypothetical protein n=1 Tax=Rhodococcus sp. X156 TaxID=2499145 RepID=UPI001F4931E4|nr:hypothetical protein [Rhodococcus sp. X156]